MMMMRMLAVRSIRKATTLGISRWGSGRFVRRDGLPTTRTASSSAGRVRPRRDFARVAVPVAVLSALAAAVTVGQVHHDAVTQPFGDELSMLLRSGALLGVSMYYQGEFRAFPLRQLPVDGSVNDNAIDGNHQSTEDTALSMLELLDDWRKRWLGGGVRGLKAQVIGRLADAVIAAEHARSRGSFAGDDIDAGQQLLRLLAGHGALSVFLEFLSAEKPTDRHLVVQLVRAIEILMESTQCDFFDEIGADLRVPLLALGSALGHLVEQDAMLFTDLLRIGDVILACRDKSLQIGGQRRPRTFSLRAIRRPDWGQYPQSSGDVTAKKTQRQGALLRDACAGFTRLCSPEMPRAMKLFSLWALTSILQTVDRNGAVLAQSRDVEEVLSPHFAALMLSLPRGDTVLQMQAAQLLDVILRLAQQNVALAPRGTYEVWMKLIQRWTGSTPHPASTNIRAKTLRDPVFSIKTWRSKRQHKNENAAAIPSPATDKGLQLLASRCLRTLSNHPLTCRYLRESPATRVALFETARHVHERTAVSRDLGARDVKAEVLNHGAQSKDDIQNDWAARNDRAILHGVRVSAGDMDDDEVDINIQANVSRAFRNVCRSFQSGHVALRSLFDSSWTASLLQSRRSLPMSRFFRNVNDLTELPVVGADEYEASTEFGWIDILTLWIASSRHEIRENAIDTLTFLAEQRDGTMTASPDVETEDVRDDGVSEKQDHILQAWLTSILQHVRLVSGGEILAVRQMEEIAKVSDEFTPGNEKVLFNPAVVDAGTSAVAVLAEHHHDELVRQGVVPLMALLSASPIASDTQKSECARVLANLVATCCQDLDATRPDFTNLSPFSDDSSWKTIWRHCVAEHFDVEQLLSQTYSGRHVLRELALWHQQDDPMQRSQYFRVISNLRAYRDLVDTGRLTRALYCEGVHPIVAKQSPGNNLRYDNDDDFDENTNAVDIVFVHGLRGHPFGTWRTDMGSSLEGSNDVWPDVLLRPDLEANKVRARIVTLGYEAGMVSWSSPWPSLSLQERARVMLNALDAANIGRSRSVSPSEGSAMEGSTRPVIFVAHSMGGLLVKKMLLLANERAAQSETGSVLAKSTAGIVFLAVPHFGSALANGVRSEAVRALVQTHPAIQDLAADSAHGGRLSALNESFARLGIDCLSMGEDRAAPLGLGLSAVVVAPQSADPGIGRFRVLQGADHMTICKAKTRDEPMYREVLDYILERRGSVEMEGRGIHGP